MNAKPTNTLPHRRDKGVRGRAVRTHRRRSAFTLLEVVLALTLSVLLLGAIFTAMDQSWKMTSRGREEMERSQLARALLRKIAIDVRSIAYVPPPPTDDSTTGSTSTGSTGSSSSSGSSSTKSSGSSTTSSSTSSNSSSSGSSSSSSSTDSTTTTTTDDVPSARSIGIRGNAQRIEMHISRARRDLDFSANVDGAKMHSHSSDLRVVTYQLATQGVAITAPGIGGGSSSTLQGLVRTEGDRLATQLSEDKGASPTSLSLPQSLAPEVANVQFRFFDGVTWYTVWDSEEAGRLPRAVEVTITFMPPQTKVGPALRVAVSQSTNTFRSVVLIPISDPLPAEFQP